ncbi:MAG TPA: branched-chain amino acid ABC transporter permease [Anaerolineaceae bacterium]|jgi:branched-chain amino acid transport system permease protein|nr:branched-chain amino acid ABC transporter permease [Anaerolineaceae bacterium]HOA22002.1 branched-chain amino acid ABC transporter permease [Anaerolineaceae bacterium]HOG77706.1 branched-chain amino acid ABC transporter permease [Anaerolineaceae bacterium]
MKKNQTLLIALIFTVALALVPLIIKKDNLLTYLCMILLYISLASSWNILGGYTGQVSLGHSAFFGLGALATRLLWFTGWNVLLAMLVGGAVAIVFALIIGSPAFKLRGAYFTIGTLALGQILFATVGNIFPQISSLPVQDLVSYTLVSRYYLFLAIALITVLVAYLIANSRLGLGMMAVREQEDAAESLGVNAFKHKLFALVISAFLAGLAGGAFAFFQIGYYPQYPFSPIWTLDSTMMAYIGGTGTILGPIIGAIFFVVLKEVLSLNLAEFHPTVFGVLFILVVLFLPGGFMGLWKRIRDKQNKKRESVAELSHP